MTLASFAGLQFIEAARILAVFIAKGKVVEQVLGGAGCLFAASISDTRGPTPRTNFTGVSRPGTLRMLTHQTAVRTWE